MRGFWGEVARELGEGRPVELVSILRASGSTPRGAGAMMAVLTDGRSLGTIGGGNVEYVAQKRAAGLLANGRDLVEEFRFRQEEAASLGMVCGGDVTVQFQCLQPAGPAAELLRDLASACAGNRDTWLIRRLEDGQVTAMGLADREGVRLFGAQQPVPEGLLAARPVLKGPWWSVPVVQAGKVYIFGGGHVSRALVPAITAVGFRPVVYDDRPEFADPALFPGAEVLCGSFDRLRERVTVTGADYVVVVTRGHQADYQVLCQVLRSGARYLGCIGSRRKLALCRERLLEEGFTQEEYARLHAPIGLSIGAETPEEIAVSITAELIAVRAGLPV